MARVKSTILAAVAAAGLVGAVAAAQPAEARTFVSVGVGLPVAPVYPGYAYYGYPYGYPGYYRPAPGYYGGYGGYYPGFVGRVGFGFGGWGGWHHGWYGHGWHR